MLHHSVNIYLMHGSHVNEIHLKTDTKLKEHDRLLSAFPWGHSWLLLHAHVAILAVNLHQLIPGAIMSWLGSRKCFVNSQIAQPAMGLVDHIINGKHVYFNASSVLVNQNLLGRSIQRFGLLKLQVLCIVVPLRVLPTEPVDS
jgi:hypothetical protein